MQGWLDDWRYAIRQLRLAPGFAAVAIITLALAIGANTAFFSLFQALVLRPLPIEHADRLVAIVTTDDGRQETGFPVPLADALAKESALFEGVAAYLGGGVSTIAADGTTAATGIVDFVTGDYFSTLRVQPLIGRLLDASDTGSLNAPAPAAVLGYRYWQRQFGGDPSVIGRVIQIDQVPFTIVGVTPEPFFGLRIEINADVTVALSAFPRVYRGLVPGQMITAQAGIARLRDGVSAEQVAAQLTSLWPALIDELIQRSPAGRREALLRNRPRVDPLETGFSFMRPNYTAPLRLLIALTALMLAIACTNLAGLLLSRAAARDREIATRLALGASRWRLARQSLTDGLLFAIAGTVCGLPLAWWGAQLLAQFFAADYLVPISLDVAPDGRVLLVTAIVTLMTALLCTIGPALRAGQRRGHEALGAARTIARTSTPWGEHLLIAQFALSLVLLVGALAFTQSLAKIRNVDPGFQIDGMHSASLVALPGRSADAGSVTYLRDLLSAAAAVPGVTAAAMTDTRPAGGYVRTVDVGSAGDGNRSNDARANLDMVSPGYFSTMAIPLEAGRELTWFDDASSPRVAIVSANLARQLFPNGDALGRRIRAGTDPARQTMEIVGIARDASVRDIRQVNALNVFIALAQEARPTSTPDLILSSTGPAPREQDLQRAIEPLGHHRVRRVRAVGEQVDRLLLRERLMSAFATFFGGMAAVLIAIGLYGLLAFAVRVRTKEIGVRLAIGASPASVLLMILRRGIRLAITGVIVGLPFALYAGRRLQASLFDVQATSPLLLASVSAFVIVLTIAAAYPPARLASRVDPATALRAE